MYVAEALYRPGRLDEAPSQADRAAQRGAPDDVLTQMAWRQVAAKAVARRGDTGKAEQLALQAVALGEPVDMLDPRADSYADLAEVFELTGQPEAAVEPLRQAAELYGCTGNLASLRRVHERLSRLRAAATG